MVSKRISELPAAGALDGTEQIPLTQDGETRRISSDTYRKSVESIKAVNAAEKYGTTLTDLQSAIDEASTANKPLFLDPDAVFTGSGEAVDFQGVPQVLAWGSTLEDLRPLIRDCVWLGGTVDQVDDTSATDLVRFGSNAKVYELDSFPNEGYAHVAYKIRDQGGVQQSNIGVHGCRGIRKGTLSGNGSFEISDCADVLITNYYGEGGTDDGLIVKSINTPTDGVTILGALLRDHVLFGTGDQCEFGVDNVVAKGLVGIDVPGIKLRAGKDLSPGGHVRNVEVEATVYDRTGTRLSNPISVLAKQDGNASMDDIDITCRVVGRFASSTSADRRPILIHTFTGSAGMGRVTVRGSYEDPHDGAPNGASEPGYPAVESQALADYQNIDKVVIENWRQSPTREKGIQALGQNGATVGLMRVDDVDLEECDLDNLGVPWIDHFGGGELDVRNPSLGPNAPKDAIQARNGSTQRSSFYHRANEPTARLERSTAQSIADSTLTDITWESVAFDNTPGGAMWASGSPTLLTLPEPGIYLVTAGVTWSGNSTGQRLVRVATDAGSVYAADRRNAIANSQAAVSFPVSVSTSLNFVLEVYQTSGGALDVLAARSTFLGAQKIAELAVG